MKIKKSLMILMVLLFAGFVHLVYANDYTYEGKVSPEVIVKEWKKVGTKDVGNGFIEYEYVNPNKKSDISVAIILINRPDRTVSSYAYLENNEPYVYWKKTDCFKALTFTSSNHKELFKKRLLEILDRHIPKSYI